MAVVVVLLVAASAGSRTSLGALKWAAFVVLVAVVLLFVVAI